MTPPLFVKAYCLGSKKYGFSAESLDKIERDMSARLPASVVSSTMEALTEQIASGRQFPNIVVFLAGPVGIEEFVAVSRRGR